MNNEALATARALLTATSKIQILGRDIKNILVDISRLIGSEVKTAYTVWDQYNKTAVENIRSLGLNVKDQYEYGRLLTKQADLVNQKYGITRQEMLKFQSTLNQMTGRSMLLVNEQVDKMGQMQRLIGEKTMQGLISQMDKFGGSIEEGYYNIAQTYELAKRFGLDASQVSEKFVENMKVAESVTFSRGLQGIKDMTLMAQRLKFDLKDIEGSMNNTRSLEGSITTSAKLQMLGGQFGSVYSNPSALLFNSLNSMEDYTQEMVKAVQGLAKWNSQQGIFEINALNKEILRTFASTMGISYDTAFNMATQGAKGEMIRNVASPNISNEALAFLQNQATYSNESGWVISFYDEVRKEMSQRAVSGLTESDIKTLMDRAAPDAMKNDVASIRRLLEDRFGSQASDLKTRAEALEGQRQRVGNEEARWIDPIMTRLTTLMVGATGLASAVGISAVAWASTKGISALVNYLGKRNFEKGNIASPNRTAGVPKNNGLPSNKETINSGGGGRRNKGKGRGKNKGQNLRDTKDLNNKLAQARKSERDAIANAEKLKDRLAQRKEAAKRLNRMKLAKVGKYAKGTGKLAIGAALVYGLYSALSGGKKEGKTTIEEGNCPSCIQNGLLPELQKQTSLLESIAGRGTLIESRKSRTLIDEDLERIREEQANSGGLLSLGLGLGASYAQTIGLKSGSGFKTAVSGAFKEGGYKTAVKVGANQVTNAGVKGIAKAVSKRIPIVGSIASLGIGAYEGYQAASLYSKEAEAVRNNIYLNEAEKNKKLEELRRERDKSYGNAAGGAIGTIVGGALGSFIGPWGTIIGAAGGQALGSWIGGGIGKLVGSANRSLTAKAYDGKTEISQGGLNTNPNQIGFSDINININGSINLTSSMGTLGSIDANTLLKNKAFLDMLVDTISNEMKKNDNYRNSINKNQ